MKHDTVLTNKGAPQYVFSGEEPMISYYYISCYINYMEKASVLCVYTYALKEK